MKAAGHFARSSRHSACNAFLRAGVFEHQQRIRRQIFTHHHERAVMVHAQRGHVERRKLTLQSDVNVGAYPEQNTLGAAPVFAVDDPIPNGVRSGRGSRGCNPR